MRYSSYTRKRHEAKLEKYLWKQRIPLQRGLVTRRPSSTVKPLTGTVHKGIKISSRFHDEYISHNIKRKLWENYTKHHHCVFKLTYTGKKGKRSIWHTAVAMSTWQNSPRYIFFPTFPHFLGFLSKYYFTMKSKYKKVSVPYASGLVPNRNSYWMD